MYSAVFPTLSVDLKALAANYTLLAATFKGNACATTVKANGYGLGVKEISSTLWESGCRNFFVATLDEAIELRAILPKGMIAVFNGINPSEAADYINNNITPIINHPGQLALYNEAFGNNPAILHVDTAMTRLGFSHTELETAGALPKNIFMIMSHLACAEQHDHPKNQEQRERLETVKALHPDKQFSLCNSAGIFLPQAFHYDMARPGCALYGISPNDNTNPMQHVATLSAPIIQLRTLDRDEEVGYGATYPAKKGAKIALCAIGYADGLQRMLGSKGIAYIGEHNVPFAGRVSMDLIALDVSNVPDDILTKNPQAEFINSRYTVNDMADDTDTIGYEIFTRLGARVRRKYT